jgi:hypothetical protein
VYINYAGVAKPMWTAILCVLPFDLQTGMDSGLVLDTFGWLGLTRVAVKNALLVSSALSRKLQGMACKAKTEWHS